MASGSDKPWAGSVSSIVSIVCACTCDIRIARIIENPRKHIKGILYYVWVIFIVNIMKRIGQKLRIIILLHFGLITFRFHYRRSRTTLIFMILKFSDASMTPQTSYFIFAETMTRQIIQGKTNHVEGTGILKIWSLLEIGFGKCWQMQGRQIPVRRLRISWNS